MTSVLRTTMFSAPGDKLTTVVRESDLAASFSELLAGVPAGCFATHDMFDMPDSTTIEQATHQALVRMEAREQRESNMAVSFYWHAMYCGRTRAGGTIANTLPSPLSVDEIRQVFVALARHPDYDNHTVISFSEDSLTVILTEGEVKLP